MWRKPGLIHFADFQYSECLRRRVAFLKRRKRRNCHFHLGSELECPGWRMVLFIIIIIIFYESSLKSVFNLYLSIYGNLSVKFSSVRTGEQRGILQCHPSQCIYIHTHAHTSKALHFLSFTRDPRPSLFSKSRLLRLSPKSGFPFKVLFLELGLWECLLVAEDAPNSYLSVRTSPFATIPPPSRPEHSRQPI